MEDEILSRALRVTDGKAAASLLQPTVRSLLACLSEERSAAEAATFCNLPLNLACYHIGRLVSLGLADEVGRRPRAGRPIKQYRARADAYFVPAELAKNTLGERLTQEIRGLIERSDFHRQGELFFIDGSGRMRVRKVPDIAVCGSADGLEFWLEANVDPRHVPDFARELREVVARYSSPSPQGVRHLFHAALARRR